MNYLIKNIYSDLVSDYISIIKSYFQRKILMFESYEDQINELKILSNEVDTESSFTLRLMIENLLVEKENDERRVGMECENEAICLVEAHVLESSSKIFDIKMKNESNLIEEFERIVFEIVEKGRGVGIK